MASLPIELTLGLLRGVVTVVVVVVAAWIDARRGIIPDEVSMVAALSGIVLSVADGALVTHGLAAGVCVAVLVGMRHLGVAWLKQPGMGWGDVKLGGALGLLLGWQALWGLYLAVACGALVGAVGLLMGRMGRRHRIPFAPFIALGVMLSEVVPVPYAWMWAELV